MRLNGKSALITGASRGIGRAAALLFAKEGAKVAVNSLTDRGESVVAEIVEAGGDAIFVQGDVQDAGDAERMVDETVGAFGRLDILFNNAGIVLPGRVDDMSLDDWESTFSVNCRGVFLVSKYAVLQMLRQGSGCIIHNASVAAVKGIKERAAYSASKGAVLALTKAMAADYIGSNIRVNCINPGTTDTPSLQERINAFDDPEAARKNFIARQPMGRLGTAEEIAAGALYLADDNAAFMTGAMLNIDGGLTI